MRWIVPWLLVMGCERDVRIASLQDPVGVDNPPDLLAPVREDQFLEDNPPQVDVLWVIDNSHSMAGEQEKLAANAGAFAQFFLETGIDWHMGVITTDVSDGGRLVHSGAHRWVDPTMPDALQRFAEMAIVGDGGSRDERGRDAILTALSPPVVDGYNGGFYRADASLHIIVISDEDDASESDRAVFLDFLRSLKPDPTQVKLSSIVGPQGIATCHTAPSGFEYIAATEATGGLFYSICTEDWSPLLAELGFESSRFAPEFFLSDVPVVSTLHVEVDQDGEVLVVNREAWSYNEVRNSVTLETYIPGYGALTSIRYTPRSW